MPINWGPVLTTDWMAQIAGATPISQISLPGAHDCTTQHLIPESPGLMAILTLLGYLDNTVCQNLDIMGLLNAGVRYLDLRLYAQPVAGGAPNLVCVHGVGMLRHYCTDNAVPPNRITFAAVQAACQAFLALHPGETIVVCIKDEEPNNQPFDATLFAQMAGAPWYLLNAIPPLGAVRGQMVLVRRFASAVVPSGIDLSTWDTDRVNENINGIYRIPNIAAPNAYVQDHYSFDFGAAQNAGNSKWNNFVLPSMGIFQLNLPANPNIPHINFTSCTNYSGIQVIANTLNPQLIAQCTLLQNTASCGWIVGDYVNAAYCRAVYEINL